MKVLVIFTLFRKLLTSPSILLMPQAFVLLVATHSIAGQMHCGPKMSPRLMNDIPCDMSKQGFCSIPGGSYPWSSVRRYIFENQGLMRRMYGDQRQSHILKNEIDDARDKYDSFSLSNGWLNARGGNGGGGGGFPIPQFSPRSAFIDPAAPAQSFSQVVPNQQQQERKRSSTSTEVPLPVINKGLPPTPDSLPVPESQLEPHANITEDSGNSEGGASGKITNSSSNPLFEEATVPSSAPEDDARTTTLDSEQYGSAKEDDALPKAPEEHQEAQPGSSTQSNTPSPSSTEQGNDFETEPIAKKGVNACPVKEEVIAPYWANNTRGETLALLNVYPFEQYVHWEKCSYENSQMFCRDGCRCEQQYRLHRLLAFDPKNECRGIFADWFRFPSCCICICYDLPDTSIFYRINRRKSRL